MRIRHIANSACACESWFLVVSSDFPRQGTRSHKDSGSGFGENPSKFQVCSADCPVTDISRDDAIAYANALSDKEGLTRCYSGSGEMRRGTSPAMDTDCRQNPSGNMLREQVNQRNSQVQTWMPMRLLSGTQITPTQSSSASRAKESQCLGPLRYEWECIRDGLAIRQ